MHDLAAHRRNMIDNQIRPNQVTDAAVLAAFAEVPREAFVPKSLAACAYVDDAVPIGDGRYLMEPMIPARLIQALEVKETDRALVVGAATGYLAAVLARLAAEVVAIEADERLLEVANRTLANLGVRDVTVVRGDPKHGYEKKAPYDVILIDGAVTEVPRAVCDQLAEGGRLGAVMAGKDGVSGRAVLMAKLHGAVSRRILFDAATPVLPGTTPEPAFIF